jgi:hypothetical protein
MGRLVGEPPQASRGNLSRFDLCACDEQKTSQDAIPRRYRCNANAFDLEESKCLRAHAAGFSETKVC